MKNILVTGALGNLGQAVVQKFIQLKYQVIGTLAPGEKGEVTGFEPATVDLTHEAETGDFIKRLLEEKGQLDVVVLTVGGFSMGDLAETSGSDIHKMIRLNFDTAYHIARPVFSHMLEKGEGRIFLVGARPGLDTKLSKGMIAYGISKSMIFRLAELMNQEAKGTGVTVTVLVPSTIDTPQNRASMPEADPSKWVKAEEIANVIAFYCSEEAGIVREGVVKLYGKS